MKKSIMTPSQAIRETNLVKKHIKTQYNLNDFTVKRVKLSYCTILEIHFMRSMSRGLKEDIKRSVEATCIAPGSNADIVSVSSCGEF